MYPYKKQVYLFKVRVLLMNLFRKVRRGEESAALGRGIDGGTGGPQDRDDRHGVQLPRWIREISGAPPTQPPPYSLMIVVLRRSPGLYESKLHIRKPFREHNLGVSESSCPQLTQRKSCYKDYRKVKNCIISPGISQ